MEGALIDPFGFLHRYSGRRPLLKRDPESLACCLATANRRSSREFTGRLYIATRRDVGRDRYYWRHAVADAVLSFSPYGVILMAGTRLSRSTTSTAGHSASIITR